MTIKHQVQGRANKRRGDAVEKRVARLLADMGYVMIERVHTPWGVIRNGKRIVSAFPREKVSGDFRAVKPFSPCGGMYLGLSVLVEVKSRPNRLLWSSLKPHQRAALDEHAAYSAHTWLFWEDSETGIIRKYKWPVAGFGKCKSLKPEGGDNDEKD